MCIIDINCDSASRVDKTFSFQDVLKRAESITFTFWFEDYHYHAPYKT